MKSRLSIAIAMVLLAASTTWAFDTVKLTTASPMPGVVKAVTPYSVTVTQNSMDKEIPVNQVDMVIFEDDPSQLRTARTYISSHRYEDALASLEKVDASQITKKWIKQDLDYYLAYCKAQLALGGTGSILDAGRAMSDFVKNNADSYHWLEANEMLGDLSVANASYAAAANFYGRLAQAPWPDFKMKAQVAIGKAKLAELKYDEAMQAFDAVLSMPGDDELSRQQKLSATLGKARIDAAQGRVDPAIKAIEGILAKSDPEDTFLQAQIYNALGTALRKAGKPKQALLAFLHTDKLYFASPDAHAEALANLAELWNEAHRPDEAVRAKQLLDTRYQNSPWAK